MAGAVYVLKRDNLRKEYLQLVSLCRKIYGYDLDIRNINHAILQYGLHDSLGIRLQVHVKKNESGAPYIQGSNIKISFSHGKNATGCAISARDIGLDIQEFIQFRKEYADFFLSAYEKENLMNADDKNLYLTAMWSLKEAYGKYMKTGLKYNFSKTEFEAIISREYNIGNLICKSEIMDESVISCVSEEKSIFKVIGAEELLAFTWRNNRI